MTHTVEHAEQCGYDIDDTGVGEILDLTCPACRVRALKQGALRCSCCDGDDGLGVWHFDSVDRLRAALPRLAREIPDDPCTVHADGWTIGFESFQEAEAWLYSRDHADDFAGTEREQWLASLRDAS